MQMTGICVPLFLTVCQKTSNYGSTGKLHLFHVIINLINNLNIQAFFLNYDKNRGGIFPKLSVALDISNVIYVSGVAFSSKKFYL